MTIRALAPIVVPAGNTNVIPPNDQPDRSTGAAVLLVSSRNSSPSSPETGSNMNSLITTSPGTAATAEPTGTRPRLATTPRTTTMPSIRARLMTPPKKPVWQKDRTVRPLALAYSRNAENCHAQSAVNDETLDDPAWTGSLSHPRPE